MGKIEVVLYFEPRIINTKFICHFFAIDRLTGQVVRVFANGPGDLGSRVKWSNLGKEVAPSSTPQCSSY